MTEVISPDLGLVVDTPRDVSGADVLYIAGAVPDLAGMVVHASEDAEVLQAVADLAANTTIILDDTGPGLGDYGRRIHPYYKDASHLAEYGVDRVLQPLFPREDETLLTRPMETREAGIRTIVTLPHDSWEIAFGISGGNIDPWEVAQLMLASARAANEDDVMRVELPAGNDVMSRKVRAALLILSEHMQTIVFVENEPGTPTAGDIVKVVPHTPVRSIISAEGQDPRRIVEEALHVQELLDDIEPVEVVEPEPFHRELRPEQPTKQLKGRMLATPFGGYLTQREIEESGRVVNDSVTSLRYQ